MQEKVKGFVRAGRVEFVNGGWTTSDESCAAFDDVLNNVMKGHAFLRQEFGTTPRVGWLTDTLDHSAGYARLQADLGLRTQIFSKMSTREIDRRVTDRSLDFVWRPHALHLGSQMQIFVSAMQDDSCAFLDSSPFVTDRSLKSFNADQKSKALMDHIAKLASGRRTTNILLPVGCNHQWSNAKYQFDQLDKAIQYVNKKYADLGKDITLLYSTASEFTNAVKAEKQAWPITHGDLTTSFTDRSAPLNILAGGYSSRPNLKKHLKDATAVNFAAQKMLAYSALRLGNEDPGLGDALKSQNEWMDVLGAGVSSNIIRGTLKERVAEDFVAELRQVEEATKRSYSKALQNWLKEEEGISMAGGMQWCMGSQNDTVFDCPIA